YADHPISKPMQGTRSLVVAAAPIEVLPESDTQESVDVTPLLRVPEREQYVGATVEQILEFIEAMQDPRSGSVIELETAPERRAYQLMVAATRKTANEPATQAADTQPADATPSQRIVVCGIGQSYIDGYLEQPVIVGRESI